MLYKRQDGRYVAATYLFIRETFALVRVYRCSLVYGGFAMVWCETCIPSMVRKTGTTRRSKRVRRNTFVTPCRTRLAPYAGHTVEAMSCHTFALRLIFITLPPSIRLFVARVLHWTYLELFLCNRCYVLISLLYAEAMFVWNESVACESRLSA